MLRHITVGLWGRLCQLQKLERRNDRGFLFQPTSLRCSMKMRRPVQAARSIGVCCSRMAPMCIPLTWLASWRMASIVRWQITLCFQMHLLRHSPLEMAMEVGIHHPEQDGVLPMRPLPNKWCKLQLIMLAVQVGLIVSLFKLEVRVSFPTVFVTMLRMRLTAITRRWSRLVDHATSVELPLWRLRIQVSGWHHLLPLSHIE